MDSNIGTTANVIAIVTISINAIFYMWQAAVQVSKFREGVRSLSDRIPTFAQQVELLEALVHQLEKGIDDTSHAGCSQTEVLLTNLYQHRAFIEAASVFLNNSQKWDPHVAGWKQTIYHYMSSIQYLDKTESELSRQIETGTARVAMQNPSGTTFILPSFNLESRPSSRLALVSTRPQKIDKCARKYIPISFDSKALERVQKWSTSKVIICPWWLTTKGYEFEFCTWASSKSAFYLRTYVTLPDDSEIFSAVESGDVQELSNLLNGGRVTPFVRDRAGCSLLHYAACSNNHLMCKRLLELGLYDCVDEKTPHGLTPGHLGALNAVWNRHQHKTSIDHLIPMFERFSNDDEYAESAHVFLLGCCTATVSAATLAHFQRIVAPHYFSKPPTSLLRTATTYTLTSQSYRHPRPDVFKFLLGQTQRQTGSLSTLLQSSEARGGLLHAAAIGLARYHRAVWPTFSRLPSTDELKHYDCKHWQRICSTLIRDSKEKELHCIDNIALDDTLSGYTRTRPISWSGSPLMSVFQALFLDDFPARKATQITSAAEFRRWPSALSSTIGVWLEQVKGGGVDLKLYGDREWTMITTRRRKYMEGLDFSLRQSCWSSKQRAFIESTLPVSLADFSYGSLVEDWTFRWRIDAEKLVGEFWDLVHTEMVSPKLPGTWIE